MEVNKKYPRKYLKKNDDLSDLTTIKKYLDEIRVFDVSTKDSLIDYINFLDETFAAIYDGYSRAYVNMTCDTANKDHEKKYMFYLEQINPLLEKENFEFSKKLVESPAVAELDRETYGILIKSLEMTIKLFREENIPLKVEDGKLKQRFQKITGSWMVKFRGEELTMQAASKVLFETDRAKREEMYRAMVDVKKKSVDEVEEIYSKMIEIRDQIAKNAGYPSYIEYAFDEKERFDYTADDCRKFHASIKKLMVPLVVDHHHERAEHMKIDSIRPWDTQVDSLGREPLKPFETVEELVEGCDKIFEKIDADLVACIRHMRDSKLLDLDSRKGKAPGGYQTVFAESREPFIFMNAVGVPRDVETLLHEGGHAFHTFLCRDQMVGSYRHAGHEFSEVASMSMELLARDHIKEFYTGEDKERYLKDQLTKLLDLFSHVAMIDAFQLWVYKNPKNTKEERWDKWKELSQSFKPYVNWDGFEVSQSTGYHFVHPFEVPLYYVEYGIAQLGALQVWLNAKKDFKKAIASYKEGLKLGGSRPLPELFKTAGGKFDMGEETIADLVEAIRKEV
jgi:oligoendopeptidase F